MSKKTTLTCGIINIEPDPKIEGRWIVVLSITDGIDTWKKPFSITTPSTPMSLEAFAEIAREKDLSKPRDPLAYLRQSIVDEECFEVELEA